MINRALDSDNEIFLLDGKIATVVDGAQVLQNTRVRLLTYLGECFLDTGRGVPYFQDILVKPSNIPLAESQIKGQILDTPGVQTLLTFEFQLDKTARQATVNFQARTEFGEVIADKVYLNI